MNACKTATILLGFLLLAALPGAAASCESLGDLKLPDTTITLAQSVAAGGFSLPEGPPPPLFKNLPSFCRVVAELKPTKDSDIKMEVWMPISGFTGNLRGQGNGGFAGVISYDALAGAVSRGYAAASTDTGHSGGGTDASWALGHPEKIIDFGSRAIHEMTVKAKAIIAAFYGEGPRHSFFASCSNGGRQALMEAQRYPADYDGVIAGAPVIYWTHVFATFIWDIQALGADPASYIPANKIPAISAAVLAACDADDGLKDEILNEPQACHFDPAVMACKDADSESCLTPKQVAALKKIYSGPRNGQGKQLFAGFVPGGESGPGGWPHWITGEAPGNDLETAFANSFFKNMIATSEPVNLKTINVETAMKLADDQQARNLDADDPDLKAFVKRGGKLIVYHGWSDAALPPLATIQYFTNVQQVLGRKLTDSFARLYMVPGMQHCGGGPGPDSFGQAGNAAAPADPEHNLQLALERWVEKGIAPDKIIATKYVRQPNAPPRTQMTRPLCPYPQIAKYNGSGDPNDAGSFACATKMK